MPQVVYPWKRFWYPRAGQISLADAGFLVDPESEYARYHSQDVRSFDAIAPSSCMVLLGEPGIGKSTALKAEFEATKASAEAVGDMAMSFDLRDYSSEERLERKVFKCDAVRSWLRGKNTLHLFLDSLDEGLLRIDNISRVILSELDELPASRLRLRIASRPADWPGSLEEGFQHFWGKENVFVFALAPLRRKDALCAARVAGLDAEAFVTDLIRAEVVPLAIKPVTLELLMATFAENKSLPARRAGLYSQGCRRLCEAPSPHRTESPNVRGRLSPGQRMAIAGRLAALSQFSNRSAFWTGPESGIEPQDIALEAVIGGSEGRNETEATVDMIGVREALDTGLFSPVALNRHGWRHQSYSEYLAAFHLHENKVPLDRLRTLFLHPDGSNRVIPQLRETATWLTSLDPDFFRMITRFDPEVVLRSDMTAASPADRADLARQLLRYFEAGGRLQSLWDLRWPFTRLENPELPTILRPYLSDKTRAKECRIAAIEIVGACKLRSLEPELVAIFSDVTEQESVRKRAIAVVGEVGSRNARAALRPIVFNEGDDDPHDELRGYALEQLWPELLSASELFDHLRPPRGPEVSASYQRFIQSGIAVSLKGTDIIRALVWANQHSAGHDKSNALNRLAAEILERAIDYIEESGVAEVLAGVVMERVRKFSDCEGLTMKLRDSSDKVRYCFAHAFIQKATGYTHGAFALIDLCSVGAPDLPWLLKELELAGDDGTRILLAEVIARCLGNASVIDFDTVLSTASRDATLNTAIGSQINAIELNSPLALRIKADYAQWASLRRPNPLPSELPFDQALLEALSDAGPTAYFQIHLLFHQRKKNLNHPTDPLPGPTLVQQSARPFYWPLASI